MPRRNDALLVSMFWTAGFQDTQLQALNCLNCCRLAHRLLFLSDIATACGRALDLTFLVPPTPDTIPESQSLLVFPNEQPSRADWRLWWDFWTSIVGYGGSLCIPLGEWVAQSHWKWEWFYCENEDMLYHQGHYTISMYNCTMPPARIRSLRENHHTQVIRRIPAYCIPVIFLVLPGDIVHRKSIGPPLASFVQADKPFWGFLHSLGGEWMWDHV
jgi:hypothetical protein